ncbi:MAG: PAS domain S-box protein [candidate division Zixibacteria bacterium]|nr:PAS domain S-box protein [candidate division Zixibacteria bacterium]
MNPEHEHLIDGKYSFRDLVDMDRLREMFESFSQATGFTTGLVSYPGQELLIGTGWRDVCTKFHRAVPQSEIHCKSSNKSLTHRLNQLKELDLVWCESGLIDGATPILIKDTHVANLFTGQILFEEPDLDYFRKQGESYGYDIEEYLKAVKEVPVVSESEFRSALSFLSEMAAMIAEQGYSNIQYIEFTKAAQESEERLRTVADYNFDWEYWVDPDGKQVYVSPSCERITGYRVDEFIQNPNLLMSIIHPDDRSKVIAHHQKAKEAGKMSPTDFRIVTSSGKECWIGHVCQPVYSEDGRYLGQRGSNRDITDRKQAEEALRQSEQQYRVIMEASLQGTFQVDAKGCITCPNPAIAELTGYSIEELEGLSMETLFPPGDARAISDSNVAQLYSGKPIIGENRLTRKDGSQAETYFSCAPVTSESGEYKGFIGSILDITDRKQAEEETKKFKTISDRSVQGSAIADLQGNILYINNSFAQIHGYTIDEIIGKNLSIFHNEKQMEAVRYINESVVEKESYGPIEVWHCHKDGTEFPMLMNGILIRSINGDPKYIAASAIDITDRIQAERMLVESEDRLANLVSTMSDWVWEVDSKGRYTYCSTNVFKILGFTAEEMIGKTPFDFMNDSERTRVGEIFAALVAAKKPIIDLENENIARDGHTVILLTSAIPLINEEGILTGYRGTDKDITDRKRAEEALRNSEARMKALSEASFESIFISDKGVCLDQNLTAERMFGYTSVEAVGKLGTEWIVPEDREIVKNNMVSCRVEPYEVIALRKDGTTFPSEIQARAAEYMGRTMRVTALRDITDRKRAEEELQKSKETAESYLSVASEIIVSLNTDGSITMLNESGHNILGYERGYLVGRNWIDTCVPKALREDIHIVFAKLMRGEIENTKTYENKIVTKNGTEKTILWHNTLLHNEMGTICGTLSSGEDITERKLIEIEREKLIAELEDKNAELERFTYTVSHDLKSPLFTVKNFIGLLRKDIDDNNTKLIEDDIRRIDNASTKMQQLMDDLLALSRIGRVTSPPANLSFRTLVNDALNLVEGRISQSNINVIIQEKLPHIRGDRQRIIEILQNILDNAAKYMGHQAEPTIEIGARTEDDSRLVFYIRDNGIGIAAKYHEKVFELFDQLDASNEGTGIGLALVKRIIEYHGSTIWIESEGHEMGCTFCFTLPSPDGDEP